MDYGKSGTPKTAKKGPKHQEHNRYGSDKTPFGSRPSKEELLARMKKSAGKTDLDKPSDPADDFATDEAKGKAIRGTENLPD